MRSIASTVMAMAAVNALSACVAAHAEPAVVSLTALTPVVVQGEGFAPGERVEVIVSVAGTEYSREALVSRSGIFEMAIPEAMIRDRCNTTIWARARTKDGNVVRAKLPEPQCPLLP
jgi:hypothetical protein